MKMLHNTEAQSFSVFFTGGTRFPAFSNSKHQHTLTLSCRSAVNILHCLNTRLALASSLTSLWPWTFWTQAAIRKLLSFFQWQREPPHILLCHCIKAANGRIWNQVPRIWPHRVYLAQASGQNVEDSQRCDIARWFQRNQKLDHIPWHSMSSFVKNPASKVFQPQGKLLQ